jgi:hypothetical protein
MLALFVPLSFLCGCSSPADSGGDPPDDPIEWEIRDSQQHVLDNLVTAYENKKAEEYLDCLSEDFIFYLNPEDVKNDPTLPYYWDKPEERDVHEAMFSGQGDHGGVDRIELTLTQDGDPTPIEVSPGVFHYQYRESVNLRMHMQEDNLIYFTTAPVLFELREDADQTGPNGETLWEICDWYDLNEEGGRAAVDQGSWGLMKALFRR